MRIVHAADKAALAPLFRRGWEPDAEIVKSVAAIVSDVRVRGDIALVEYSRRFDTPRYDLAHLRVPIPMHQRARTLIPLELAEAIDLARERIAAFHERQKQVDIEYTESDGTRYGFYRRALGAIAAYVPGGTASLPSSVLMSIVPAKIAGVERTIVLAPPQEDGTVSKAVLYACSLCDVDELYAVGGAHAIAAAAYGTRSIQPVDKIVGPGNVWVTEAKRQVYGVCAIDGLAGPSEVLVVADDGANVEYVVGELLAQAEHDPMARVGVVSTSRALLESCAQLLESMRVDELERANIIAQVLECGAWFVEARDRDEILAVVEHFAPEHLSLQVEDVAWYVRHLRRVGAVFGGGQTPVAAGDYIAGTNHVLPTSGAARFSSGLQTADFLRTFTFVQNSDERMNHDAPMLELFARFEGLPQHAQTARMRLERLP